MPDPVASQPASTPAGAGTGGTAGHSDIPASEEDLRLLRASRVPVRLPTWILGGHPERMANFLRWDVADGEEGIWRARTAESVRGERPGLVRLRRTGLPADPANPAGYQRSAEALREYDHFSRPGSWARAREVHEELTRDHQGEFAAVLTSFRTLTVAAERAQDLPEVFSRVMPSVVSALPDAGLFFLNLDEVLGRRNAITRAMLDPTGLPVQRPGGTAFDSSLQLMDGPNFGLAAYLEPLVTSLSPRVWATTAPRAGGVFILSFGADVVAEPRLDLNILNMSRRNAHLGRSSLGIAPDAFADALRWWVTRLDLVFSHLTQPANHMVGKFYSPPAALERLLAFEQLCRSVQTIGVSQDEHARRLALFHSLDSLEGINPKLTRRRATTLGQMRSLLREIQERMPATVAAVLLPRAAEAVDALTDVQTGFFGFRRREGSVDLPDKSGGAAAVPLDVAAREWLSVLRNSQHGFDKEPSPRDRALLAAHDGSVPPRLPDLAWLALLELLTFPDRVNRPRRPPPRR